MASRAAGVVSSRRREWPSVRGDRWAGARKWRRHLDHQGQPRSAPELWEDQSDLDVGAERADQCLFRGAASAQRERRRRRHQRQRRTSSSLVGERERSERKKEEEKKNNKKKIDM
jgi:hypothetical protein